MNVKIERLEHELNTYKTPIIEVNNDTSEDFNCEKCGYVCKREATLRKHINTKHQLNDEEVNIVIHNESTDKELKKAKRQIKELEDKVENLALGKAKADCEVNQLRTETDSLRNILSLRPSIDNPLPVKQTKKKK